MESDVKPGLSPVKTGLTGLGCGFIAAIVTFVPISLVRIFVAQQWMQLFANSDLSLLHIFLVAGLPLPWALILAMPLGGALLGLAGATVGVWRAQRRGIPAQKQLRVAMLWGALGGTAVHLFMSFWAQ
jgi:hypothetical protein